MYPILLCSVLALAITIERLLFYHSCVTEPDFITKLLELMGTKDYDKAVKLASEYKGDCARLTKEYMEQETDDMTVLEANVNLALDSYDEHIEFLDMIVTVSPLLGLLGTIMGMISAFKVFDLRAGQPFAITAGIGEALFATAFGLIVAILALALHCLLRYYSDRLGVQLKQCCAVLELRKMGAVK